MAEAESPYSALDTAEAALWQTLGRASRDRRAPWHTPVLATVGADGAPQARVLVLRDASRSRRMIRLHTDRRTEKADAIGREPRVALLFYDFGAKLQLRLSGTARIEGEGPAADAAWAATTLFARRCYQAPIAPGARAEAPTSGLPPELEGREPTLEESEAGRANFAVLLVEAARLEFLHLAVTGHRRGLFCYDRAQDRWEGRWLIP
jgi:hypothetical protein